MVAQGLFSVGGIASGLDTDGIVNQLLQLERQPIVRIEQQQKTLQTTRDAWGQINTRLSALRAATDQFRRPDRFADMTKVTSSDPSAVAVTKGPGFAGDTDLSFTVSQLATRMQVASNDDEAGRFSGRDELLGERTLTIATADGTQHDLTSELGADATLSDLVAAVNDAGLDIRASALEVEPGTFRLLLESEQTGSAGAFTIDETWLGTTQAAQDAELMVGNVQVTRSSNTIDDLIPGATLELTATTSEPVTVRAERDVDGAVAAVKDFVSEANSTIRTIGELTAYDQESDSAGPLQGEFRANQLAFDIRTAVTAPVAGLTGTDALASSVGLSVDRDGVLQLDEAKLRQAFTDDFEGTAQRFGRTGRASDPDAVSGVSGASRTQAGTYEVEITKAATVARQVGAYYGPPGEHQPKNFMVRTPGGTVVSVQIDTADATTAHIRDRIQQALDAADVSNLQVGLEEDAGGNQAIRLESTRFGDAASFEVWAVDEAGERIDGDTVYGLAGEHRGTDVEGRIGTVEGTGSGRMLSFADGPADGLNVETAAGLMLDEHASRTVDVTYWHGIGGAVDQQLAKAEGSGGVVARAQGVLDSQKRFNQDRIDQIERRLESREVTLRRQFVAMEQAMDRFNSQGQWLQGQLGQLSAMNAQRR